MSEVDKNYDLTVEKMIINKYLDETISVTDKSVKALEANRERVVWDLATKFYSQCGHKMEFSTVRDVVNCRIETIQYQLAAEKNRIAEKARKLTEIKACRTAEEARQTAEEEADFPNQGTHVLGELGGDDSKANVFVRVRKILSEQLCLDENEVNNETRVFSVEFYLGDGLFFSMSVVNFRPEEASSYRRVLSTERGNATEILMALEEEFDIEIPDSDAEDLHTLKEVVDYIVQKKVV